MKRIFLTLCLAVGFMASWAQVDAKYAAGKVPVLNGRVTFQDTIATTLSPEAAYAKVSAWAKERFNKPNVIISKFITDDARNCQLNFTAEEYLVFTNRFFVLDRTRINYWMEMKSIDNGIVLKLTRINYWYEEEREGGLKFSAEDMITDENVFNRKGKMLKDQGKFRRKTIDFFEDCVMQISKALS